MSSTSLESGVLCAALADLPVGLMLLGPVRDHDGAIVDLECRFINPAAAGVLGVDREALQGHRVLERWPTTHADACLRVGAAVIESGEPLETDLGGVRTRCTKAADGVSMLLLDALELDRGPCPFVGADTITLLSQAPFAAAIVWGPEHRFALANRAYEEMVGREALSGKTFREAFPELPVDAPVVEMLDRVRATGRPFSASEYCVPLDLDGDGVPEDHYYRFTSSPVLAGGEVVAIQSVAFEVTALIEGRRQAEELAKRLEVNITERESIEATLREQVRQKDDFLAMLGHELRNPLAAVRSASEVLESVHTEDATLRRVRQVLERQTSHMARLLDDLLDLARIRSGKLTIEPTVLDLCEVVLEVVSDLGPDVREHRFTVEVPPRPLWVRGDRTRLAQVTHNLIGNALKYTPPQGTVSVRLGCTADGAVLTVTDSGVGIDPEFRPRLFRPFQQAPQGIARSSGGLGLGLALSKTIIELHHGTIEARSEGRGCGSELEVWLPLAAPEPVLGTATGRQDAGRARIMLVEDNEDAAELLAALLRARGHEVYIAGRGREALTAMEHWRPDAVICDIGLPDIDGYAVARAIRADPALEGVDLIALSGYGQDEDRRRSAEAGFDVHFTKPTDVEEILRAIHVPSHDAGPPGDPR